MTYCEAILQMEDGNVHKLYHDKEYGFPVTDDNNLFARLVLEINQAGLSWTTILNKKENFFRAYHQFDIDTVAEYDQKQTDRLLQDAGIVRNRLKIAAAIENARRVRILQREFGSFKNWLNKLHPKSKGEWIKIVKENFKFTGGEIVNEFLQSTGYLPGAHITTCPIYKKVLLKKPLWNQKVNK